MQIVRFGSGQIAVASLGDLDIEVDRLVREEMKRTGKSDYKQALQVASARNPEIFLARERIFRQQTRSEFFAFDGQGLHSIDQLPGLFRRGAKK